MTIREFLQNDGHLTNKILFEIKEQLSHINLVDIQSYFGYEKWHDEKYINADFIQNELMYLYETQLMCTGCSLCFYSNSNEFFDKFYDDIKEYCRYSTTCDIWDIFEEEDLSKLLLIQDYISYVACSVMDLDLDILAEVA